MKDWFLVRKKKVLKLLGQFSYLHPTQNLWTKHSRIIPNIWRSTYQIMNTQLSIKCYLLVYVQNICVLFFDALSIDLYIDKRISISLIHSITWYYDNHEKEIGSPNQVQILDKAIDVHFNLKLFGKEWLYFFSFQLWAELFGRLDSLAMLRKLFRSRKNSGFKIW